MGGMLEDDQKAKKTHMEKCTKQYNKYLAQHKHDSEKTAVDNQKSFERNLMDEVHRIGQKIDFEQREQQEMTSTMHGANYTMRTHNQELNELTAEKDELDKLMEKLATLDHDVQM